MGQEAGTGLGVTLGGQTRAMDEAVVQRRPGVRSYIGAPIVAGIRPEDMEDGAVVPDHPGDRRLHVTIDLREALGAETLMYFGLTAAHVDSGDPDLLDDPIGSASCRGRV